MPKFSDSLAKAAKDVTRPPVLPVGHYIWQVEKYPEFDEFTSQNTGDTFERVTFQLLCISASDDVDPDDLAAYGSPSGARNRKTFLFNTTEEKKADYERSEYNLKRFLVDHCGLPEKATFEELLTSSVGAQFLGEVYHRPDQNDPEIVYAEVNRTTAV